MFHAESFTVGTRERGTREITDEIQRMMIARMLLK